MQGEWGARALCPYGFVTKLVQNRKSDAIFTRIAAATTPKPSLAACNILYLPELTTGGSAEGAPLPLETYNLKCHFW